MCPGDRTGWVAWAQSRLSASPDRERLQDRGGVGSLCEKDVTIAVPCSSSSLAPAIGTRVNVQAEDSSICFACCYNTSQTKLWSLCSAASYLVLPHGLDCPVWLQAHRTAEDCLSHSSPHRSSLSSAGFSPSNSCRVDFAKWHKVIINQVRRLVLCFLLYRKGPYCLITSSVRQSYVYKISEVMCNCQDPMVWFETSMQWTFKCCRCAMK